MPAAPLSMTYLFHVWQRLRRRKASTGFGLPPIEWPDIFAYVHLTRTPLAPWEIGVIEEIDDLYLAERSRQQKPPPKLER